MNERICYAMLFVAEAFIAWLYFEYLFSRKVKISTLFFTFLMGYSLLFFVSKLGIATENAVSFYVVNLILLKINYQCFTKTAILHSAFLCFVMLISEVLVALLISQFGHEFSAYTYDFSVMIVLIILSKILYMVFSIIGARVFAPHKHPNEEPHLMVLFCIMPLLSALLAIIIIYIGMNSEMTTTSGFMMLVNVLSLLLVNLLFMILYNHLQKANAEQLTLQLSLQKEQADAAYYNALQEQYENQRILVHDIRNHLRSIAGLASQGKSSDVEQYVSRLDNEIKQTTHARLCSNPILNMLLIQISNDCKTNYVDFHCDVRENCIAFMDAPSITTLYGNLLSNAFESASSSADRLIELSVKPDSVQNAIIISVINSCDTAPISSPDGRFVSIKKNLFLHGVGLKSIERIVRKYNGISTMYYDSKRRRFHHIIQFPCE